MFSGSMFLVCIIFDVAFIKSSVIIKVRGIAAVIVDVFHLQQPGVGHNSPGLVQFKFLLQHCFRYLTMVMVIVTIGLGLALIVLVLRTFVYCRALVGLWGDGDRLL